MARRKKEVFNDYRPNVATSVVGNVVGVDNEQGFTEDRQMRGRRNLGLPWKETINSFVNYYDWDGNTGDRDSVSNQSHEYVKIYDGLIPDFSANTSATITIGQLNDADSSEIFTEQWWSYIDTPGIYCIGEIEAVYASVSGEFESFQLTPGIWVDKYIIFHSYVKRIEIEYDIFPQQTDQYHDPLPKQMIQPSFVEYQGDQGLVETEQMQARKNLDLPWRGPAQSGLTNVFIWDGNTEGKTVLEASYSSYIQIYEGEIPNFSQDDPFSVTLSNGYAIENDTWIQWPYDTYPDCYLFGELSMVYAAADCLFENVNLTTGLWFVIPNDTWVPTYVDRLELAYNIFPSSPYEYHTMSGSYIEDGYWAEKIVTPKYTYSNFYNSRSSYDDETDTYSIYGSIEDFNNCGFKFGENYPVEINDETYELKCVEFENMYCFGSKSANIPYSIFDHSDPLGFAILVNSEQGTTYFLSISEQSSNVTFKLTNPYFASEEIHKIPKKYLPDGDIFLIEMEYEDYPYTETKYDDIVRAVLDNKLPVIVNTTFPVSPNPENVFKSGDYNFLDKQTYIFSKLESSGELQFLSLTDPQFGYIITKDDSDFNVIEEYNNEIIPTIAFHYQGSYGFGYITRNITEDRLWLLRGHHPINFIFNRKPENSEGPDGLVTTNYFLKSNENDTYTLTVEGLYNGYYCKAVSIIDPENLDVGIQADVTMYSLTAQNEIIIPGYST